MPRSARTRRYTPKGYVTHLLIEGPNTAITVGLRSPREEVGTVLLTWSHLLPAQASLHELAWPAPAAAQPQAVSRSLKGALAEFKQPKVACRVSLQPLSSVQVAKHQVSPGKPPQALTSNAHLVYYGNIETQGQSQWRVKCSMPQFTHP